MPYYGGTPMATDPAFLMDRLMKNGYSREQAAAIIGNLQKESGLHSNNVNKDEGAYGLMQWRGPRFEALQQFAAAKGTAWTDPGTQADFIAHEMRTTENRNAQGFLQARTVDEASNALHPVIRYGDESGPERAAFARNAFGRPDTPEAATAQPVQATPPAAQPAAAQRPVSRETMASLYGDPAGQGSNARGIRGGLNSIGDAFAAYAKNPARAQANFASLGNRISSAFGGQQPTAQPPVVGGGAPARVPLTVPASAVAPVTDLQSHTPVSETPPGARDQPLFPGGVPMPRERPQTGPGMFQGDLVTPEDDLTRMGSLVDPTTGFDYG